MTNRLMDNDQMPDRDVEDVELASRLEAYAEARLSPSLSASSRMRAKVMAAAHRQAALARADADRAALAGAELSARTAHARRSRWQRPVAALLAACLTLTLAVGSVAAARPGGPLYGARIWIETLTLPTSAADRAAAEARRLSDRLSEAADAMAAGDASAAEAALAAYNAILAEATAGTNGDATANETLDTAVRRNIEVLTVLLDRVPEQARDAIENAIERSDSASNGLRGKPAGGEPPSATPGHGPSATTKPDRTANPNKPAQSANPNKPDRSPNPNKPTPRPTPAPVAATASAQGDATPKPHPTPKPHVTPEPVAATPTPEPTPKAHGKPSSPPGRR